MSAIDSVWSAKIKNKSVRVKEVEPAVGIEPTTDGLQNRCSTTELSWREREYGGEILRIQEKSNGANANSGKHPSGPAALQIFYNCFTAK